MAQTIDTQSLERAIVRHCSPTLAALKPAGLFTVAGEFIAKPDSPSSPAELEARRRSLMEAVDTCERTLKPARIRIRVLVWRFCGALVYVYRPDMLARYLADPRASRALAARGYDPADIEGSLALLAQRTAQAGKHARAALDSACTRCPCEARTCVAEFPHEMGFFLGYPYEDVTGFIEHRGQDFLALGLWKVYAHLDRALATFERYRSCTARYQQVYQDGARLSELAAVGR